MKLFDVYPYSTSNLFVLKVRGFGTKKGTRYLDLYGGHAVISIGHGHPAFKKAITDQLGKISFYSNSVENSFQRKLADKLG